MENSVILDKDLQDLLVQNNQPTTIAEVATKQLPPVVVEEIITEEVVAAVAPKVKKQPMSDSMQRSFVGSLVTCLDFAQGILFCNLADKKMESQTKAIAGNVSSNYVFTLLKKKHDAPDTVFNEDETKLIVLFNKIQDFKNDVAYDDHQAKGLEDALILYMKDKDIQFSAETYLMFMLFSSIVPNAMQLKTL
jgi:hypothetical protein